jgi:hypothetical protein
MSHDGETALDGLSRRRFLTIGGTTVAMSAVFAACGGGGGGGSASSGSTTSTTAVKASDVNVLRTGNSIEAAAVAVYKQIADNEKALGLSSPVSDMVTAFQKHHKDHGDLLAKATTDAGGTPYAKPNSVVMAQLQPALSSAKTETDVLNLLLTLEKAAAATYQAPVGTFTNKTYNETVMSVGGVEAKHVTVIAAALKMNDKLITNGAFQTPDGAIKSGSGIS